MDTGIEPNWENEAKKLRALVLAQQQILNNIPYILNVFICDCSWGGGCSDNGGHGDNMVPFKIHALNKTQAKEFLLKSLRNTLITFLKNGGYYSKDNTTENVKIFDFKQEWNVKIVANLAMLANGDIYFIRYIKFIKKLLELVFDPDTDCINLFPPSGVYDFDNINTDILFHHHLQFMKPVKFNSIEEYFTDPESESLTEN